MRWRERHGRLEVPGPIALERCGECEDEVQRPVLEAGVAKRVRRGDDAPTVVRAVHPREGTVVERLNASETRFTPAARQAATAVSSMSSGFASSVISAPAAGGSVLRRLR